MLLFILILIVSLQSSMANAQCVIYYKDSPLPTIKQDAVSLLLDKAKHCPQSIQSFKQLIEKNNLQVKTSMVANRGKNNPDLGSFSFFETITGTLADGFQIKSGDFYLGHFTTLEQNEIKLDQLSEKNKLLIELIAWDNETSLFNFYELKGIDSTTRRWYYRGNSEDALLDNQYLYRNNPPNSSKFGNRMRCSACHNSGEPIIKEIKAPHNDWWSHSNQLIFSPNQLDDEVNLLVNALVESNDFSKEVMAGINKLNQSIPYNQFKKSLSLQEQLRPLFCTTEINIESNKSEGLDKPITIPSGFFLNPLLAKVKIVMPSQAYQDLLIKNNMQFPETNLRDADHGWLTPVKGVNDIIAIKQLIQNNVVTRHFAQSVLMIDFSHPLFSKPRCELLKLIPAKSENNWEETFINELHQSQKNQSEALLLATYLINTDKYNQYYFQQTLDEYKNEIEEKAKSTQGRQALFNQLLETRQSVLDNEISKNPLGQILEPGFRVIFPVVYTLS